MIVDLTEIESGFCDRLKILIFYVAVAQIKHDNVLYIKENRTLECPFIFTEVCKIDGFNVLPWNSNVIDESLIIDRGFEVNLKPSIKFVRQNKPKDVNISDHSLLKIWVESYRKIHPRVDIRQKIESQNIGFNCLGLHIRMTDKVVNNIREATSPRSITTSQIAKVNKLLEKEILNYFRKHACNFVFLASDDLLCKEQWKNWLQKNSFHVITNNAQSKKTGIRQTSGEDFIVDLFSLAKCEKIFGTVHSGVSISAAYINGSRKYSFILDSLIFCKWTNHVRWYIYRYCSNVRMKNIKYKLKNLVEILLQKIIVVLQLNTLDASLRANGFGGGSTFKETGEEYFITKILPNFIRKDKPVLFDIGAHRGLYSKMLRQAFSTSIIYCFEPNPILFGDLKQINDTCHVFHTAMNDKTGPYNLYYSDSVSVPFDHTQLASGNREVYSKIYQSNNIKTIACQADTVDNFCKTNGIDHIDFLKIDTEGNELNILKGARKLLETENIDVIQFEFNEMNILSKTFIKDFEDLLPNYDLFRIRSRGLIPIANVSSQNLIFMFQNIVAINHKISTNDNY